MAIFRCTRSGNTVSFLGEGDIAGMRTHEGYCEVFENDEELPKKEAPKATPKEEVNFGVITAKVFKKLGRPKKK